MAEVPFPEGAKDGTVFFHEDKVCIYSEPLNTWECRKVVDPEDPENPNTGFIYTTDVLVADGFRDRITAARQSNEPIADTAPVIQTQQDVNDAILDVTILGAKNVARTADLFDFSQNTVVQGYWTHVIDEGGNPGLGQFYAYDENGFNTIQFLDVKTLKINDTGVPGSPNDDNILAAARIGDYLVVQSTTDNHFGAYVVTGLNLYNVDGTIIRELIVKVYNGDRAFGDVEYSDTCSIRILRPRPVIVQEEEPDVSQRGLFWYRESDDILSISNYPTGMMGGQGPQWTEINGGGDTSALETRVSAGEQKQIELEGRISQGEQRQGLLTTNLGVIQGDYLSKTNSGTVNGLFTIDIPSGTALKIKKNGSQDHVKIEAGGKIFCDYNMDLDTDRRTVPNKGWVQDRIDEIEIPESQPSGPTTKYDGNRFCKAGISGNILTTGDVMFFNSQLASTTNPAQVYSIALPIDEFDWDKCGYSGIIKVKSGAAVAGCYLVYDYQLMEGKMMILYVRAIATENVVLEADSGCPCYFRGVFFE